MNAITKQALEEFADAVIDLATGTVHMIGVQTAAEICQKATNLKAALKKDETIIN